MVHTENSILVRYGFLGWGHIEKLASIDAVVIRKILNFILLIPLLF